MLRKNEIKKEEERRCCTFLRFCKRTKIYFMHFKLQPKLTPYDWKNGPECKHTTVNSL